MFKGRLLLSATNIQNVSFMLMVAKPYHLTDPGDQLFQGAGSARRQRRGGFSLASGDEHSRRDPGRRGC